jgi:hypothetical protein
MSTSLAVSPPMKIRAEAISLLHSLFSFLYGLMSMLPLFGHFSFVLLCLVREPLSFWFLFVASVMYFPPPPLFFVWREASYS